MYERGNREPSFEIMEEIADLFNVDMNFLLGKSQERNATQINIKISAGGENEQKESLADVEHQEAVEKAAELFSRLSEEEQQQALTYIEFLLHKR
nr:MAG TPA: nucleoid-associated protein [Caudoviricetes sp.]DAM92671.1 MAG TPA: nucleoid-associated protein [Caudoviricetes sp.]